MGVVPVPPEKLKNDLNFCTRVSVCCDPGEYKACVQSQLLSKKNRPTGQIDIHTYNNWGQPVVVGVEMSSKGVSPRKTT